MSVSCAFSRERINEIQPGVFLVVDCIGPNSDFSFCPKALQTKALPFGFLLLAVRKDVCIDTLIF